MDEYQNLIKKLSLINEGASIVTLDVNASSNDAQQLKTVLVGLTLSNGAQISATFQAPCFETLLESLETFFNVQAQVIEQAIEQVNVMAATDDGQAAMDPMAGGMEPGMDQDMGMEIEPEAAPVEMEPEGGDEYSFDLGAGEPEDDLADGDVVVDTDEMEPEMGDDVEADEARYSHQYSFRNKGTGLFQSLTGQQRIQKGALRTARKRLGN